MASTLPPLAQATSGALASVVSNLLVYPLDTVTTRMQTSKGHPSLLASLKKIARQDGWLSVYRGLGSDSLSTAISQFAYFFLYALLHKQFLRHKIRKAVAAELAPDAGKRSGKASPPMLSALEGLLVGCLAGMVAKGIVAPLSNITVRQQTSSTAKAMAGDAEKVEEEDSDDDEGSYSAAPSMLEIARDILQEKGWTGLWSGYKSSIVLVSSAPSPRFDLLR